MRGRQATLGRVQRSIEQATRDAPATETAALLREVGNRVEAFSLFECAHEVLALEHGRTFSLEPLLARADAQGLYRSVFLKEGLGYLYAKTWLHRGRTHGARLGGATDARSLAPLHMGAGVSLAEHTLHHAEPGRVGEAIETFFGLWREAAHEAWQISGGEPLGFAVRVLFPTAVAAVGRLVGNTAAADYYWHGVGRGLYFAPALVVPLCGAHARAMWCARSEAPTATACRNMVAGWAWAMTLTNVRDPELVEGALVHATEAAPPADALHDGIAGAVALLAAASPRNPETERLFRHRPGGRHAGRVWDALVRPACASVATAAHLPAAFRYREP